MNLNGNRKAVISTIGAVFLLIALVALVALAQKQQNIRSKASPQDQYNALDVTDSTNIPLPYKDENGLRTYETQSLDVQVKVNDLRKLIDEDP